MSVIEVMDLCKSYGSLEAVSGISFSIGKGEIVGFLGPNGAGKTTTMRTICGFVAPTSGTVKVAEDCVMTNCLETKSKIGYLPESASMYADMLVGDYLLYIAKVREVADPAGRVATVSMQCGLREKMHFAIGELSKGYKQRVGLAHAMMSDPQILILDEPTSGLDPNQIQEIRALIKDLGRSKTVILSTHILSEVEAICNRVIIISGGKIVIDSTTKELFSSKGDAVNLILELSKVVAKEVCDYVQTLSGVESIVATSEGEGVSSFKVVIKRQGGRDVRAELSDHLRKKNWTLLSLQEEMRSLEAIFRELTLVSGKE